MPSKRAKANPSHSDWSQTCLEQVPPLNTGKAGAIAPARQLDDAGVWHPLLVLLTENGEAISASDWLPDKSRANAGCLTLTDKQSALLVVGDAPNTPGSPYVDARRWFSVRWRGAKITISEIGVWNNLRFGSHLQGVQIDEGSVWAAQYYPSSPNENDETAATEAPLAAAAPGGPLPDAVGFFDTKIVLSLSKNQEASTPQFTNVDSVDFSPLVPMGDEVYVLVNNRSLTRFGGCNKAGAVPAD